MPRVDCEQCQHYRTQASFVDAHKVYDRGAPRKPIMEALKSVREEETDLLGQEAELVFELFRVEEREWPVAPRLAPYCGLGNRHHVAAVKNRRRDCADFEPAFSRQGRGCQTCTHATEPETKVGDREVRLDRHDPQYWQHWMSVNKEREEADAQAQGVEIEQAFYGDGRLPFVRYLPTCAVKSTNGMQHVVPFCNLRMDCEDHRPILPLTRTLEQAVRARAANRAEPHAVEATLALVRAIADLHPHQPAAFLERTAPVAGAASWTAFCVRERWLRETSTTDAQALALASQRAATAAGQPTLFPVIAGCDALEWGALAAMSRAAPGTAVPAAAVFVQQFAEWFAATFDPTDRIRGVDAGLALLASGAFSETTVERVETFLRRLRTQGDNARHALRHDFPQYVETVLGAVSTAVANDLRALQQRRERERRTQQSGMDEATLRSLGMSREEVEADARVRFEAARARAALLVSAIELILAGRMMPDLGQLWRSISETEQKELGERMQKMTDRQQRMVNNKLAEQGLMSFDVFRMWGIMQGKTNETVKLVDAMELQPRRTALLMLLCRGLEPVTPSALVYLKREPTPQRVPETLQEALNEPAARQLEVLHAERFKPAPAAADYLRNIRRMSFPTTGARS
jgi:hypothetical protein